MNYEFKGTPGPWMVKTEEAELEGREFSRFDISDTHEDDRTPICSGYGNLSHLFASKEQGAANAHLIAAAPDLLQLAINYLGDLNNIFPASDATLCRMYDVKEVLNKALNR